MSVVQTTYAIQTFPAAPEGRETLVRIALGNEGHDRGEIWKGPWLQLQARPDNGSAGDCINCHHEGCGGGFRLPIAALKQFLEQNPGVLE